MRLSAILISDDSSTTIVDQKLAIIDMKVYENYQFNLLLKGGILNAKNNLLFDDSWLFSNDIYLIQISFENNKLNVTAD